MTLRESDDCVVPMTREDQSRAGKPGNTGAGKAVRISRDRDRASSVLRDGITVLTRLDRSFGTVRWTAGPSCFGTVIRTTSVLTVQLRFVLTSAGWNQVKSGSRMR